MLKISEENPHLFFHNGVDFEDMEILAKQSLTMLKAKNKGKLKECSDALLTMIVLCYAYILNGCLQQQKKDLVKMVLIRMSLLH